jgi:putative ABC transport system permease protein
MLKLTSLPSVIVGMQTLRVNPLRTMLSTLGIIIGVASLVAILALGDGLEQFSREQIEFTTDLQTVIIDTRTTERLNSVMVRRADIAVLTPQHAEALGAALADVATTMLTVRGAAPARLPGDTLRYAVLVAGALANVPDFLEFTMEEGRFFTRDEVHDDRPVVVLSTRLASEFSGAHEGSLIGSTVIIRERSYEVIGILQSTGNTETPIAYVPVTGAAALLAQAPPRTPTLMVKALQVEDVQAVEARARNWLDEHVAPVDDNFNVATSTGRLAQAQQGILVFKLVMGAITGISILVGGIGVMNVLLASVSERTREIGVRKSIGANRRDILVQFLAESVAISGLGSGVGVITGMTGAFVITAVIRRITEAPVYAAFTWGTVLVAGVAAVVVGIVFGTYPARRAAKLSPIDAIRHE